MPNNQFFHTNLPPDLRVLKEEIEGHAKAYGLDFYETIFEVVDADDLNEIAAYGGFPTRYPHWSFGMQYEELRRGYDYGLSKIYEMVINNDPCYAYLMRSNLVVDQKLVMAHVYGHCDFFKNNAFFNHTTRKMMDEIANHGARIRHFVERFGEDEVETFLDRCMSIDDLIDIHSVAIKRRDEHPKFEIVTADDETADDDKPVRFKSKPYMDDYINPHSDEAPPKPKDPGSVRFPDEPQKDVLLFLIEHAPLKNWQRDMLSIVRDEAYYFYPQGQTKIMNEGWACLAAGSLVVTDRGFMDIADVATQKLTLAVADGESTQAVRDWAVLPERDIVRIRTRRGLKLTGSTTHRILDETGVWRRLDELHIGDRIKLARGTDLWAKEYQRVAFAGEAGVATRVLNDTRRGRSRLSWDRHLACPESDSGQARCLSHMVSSPVQMVEVALKSRRTIELPEVLDESFAAFLGYLIGDGHISATKRTIGLTTGDESRADDFAALTEELFGIVPVKKWAETKWRVRFSSSMCQDFLVSLGLKTGVAARVKTVPDAILRSPKPVVAAFLRALYDCDGYAGPAGVILSTSSTKVGEVVQQLLLNFGILSRLRPHKDGCWHVHTQGVSARLFGEQIGFGLDRKQARLRSYLDGHRWFKVEDDADEVVAIEHGRAPVYDLTVANTHRYAAGGFINHNSFWHSTIMTQKVLQPSELIDYADHHSGTMATSGQRINPYKLGIELLRDIEHRWNTGRFGAEWDACDDAEARRNWDRPTGLGRKKIFEVRKVHNDITFIDTYLTPEFCKEHKMFSFAHQDATKNYVVESREFEQVKSRLLFSLTNFGKPYIEVLNGNHRNRGELLLRHRYNGVELKIGDAQETMVNLRYIWGRPVHIETVIDDKPVLLSFDGTEQTRQPIGGKS